MRHVSTPNHGPAARQPFDSPGWATSPDTPGRGGRSIIGKRRQGVSLQLLYRPLFVAGLLAGIGASWLAQFIFILFAPAPPLQPDATVATSHQSLPHSPPPVAPDAFHAIVVPAGGQGEAGPPPHVAARLEEAVRLYRLAKVKPFIVTTAWGTPHKVTFLAASTSQQNSSSTRLYIKCILSAV